MTDNPTIIFFANIGENNGVPCLQLRKFISKKEEIRLIGDDMSKKGYFEFKGRLIFVDKDKAFDKLNSAGLYKKGK